MIPKVSVCLITYNHEKYIEKAIEGILHQKTDFIYEIIVGDDLSTDSTMQIINRYKEKNNTLFNILCYGQKMGMHKNWEAVMAQAKGEYIALLEGDDFWTDPYKLAKQVEVLDKNQTIAISFTNASVINELNDKVFSNYVEKRKENNSLLDLLEFNFIPTCTVVYRNKYIQSLPKAFFKSPYADWIIHCIYAQEGDIHFLNSVTASYRLHSNGVYGGSDEESKLKNGIKTMSCIIEIVPKSYHSYCTQYLKKSQSKLLDFYKSKKMYFNVVRSYIKKS